MGDNPFINRTESQALNQTGIAFNPPTEIHYGDEINSTWEITGTLANIPVTQSEFFTLFGYNGASENRKLTLVTDAPDSNGEFGVNYETGLLTFFNNQSGHNVTPVYSYGGNITISTGTATTNCIKISPYLFHPSQLHRTIIDIILAQD